MTETFRAQVDRDGGIEYSRGIARQHGIEPGDSIRVELVETTSGEGRSRIEPEEVFVVDLDVGRETRFQLPGELREQYDITGEDVVRLRIHQVIKDGRAKTLGDASLVTPPEGEPVFSVVDGHDRRVAFSDGLARLHDIEPGQSVRVTLTEVTMPWGETIETDIGETFVADLTEHDPTQFTIPDGVCEEYKIREGGFVRFRLHALIRDGEVEQITDRARTQSDRRGFGEIDIIETREDRPREPSTTDRSRSESQMPSREKPETPADRRSSGTRADDYHSTETSDPHESIETTSIRGSTETARSRRTDRTDTASDAGSRNSNGDGRVRRDGHSREDSRSTVSGLSTATQQSLSDAAEQQSATTEYVPGHDSRELLEAIVADAFASLEYDVDTNVRKATGDGNAVKEIDVWAEKPGVTFSAYASCKNHQSEVGTPVIDREAGRVSALQQFPHLKVIVAPRFNDNARQALDNRGFVGVETGEQATMENAGLIYDRVRTQLADLSLSLAPPRIQDLAERVDQVSAELSSLSGELRDLEDAPSW